MTVQIVFSFQILLASTNQIFFKFVQKIFVIVKALVEKSLTYFDLTHFRPIVIPQFTPYFNVSVILEYRKIPENSDPGKNIDTELVSYMDRVFEKIFRVHVKQCSTGKKSIIQFLLIFHQYIDKSFSLAGRLVTRLEKIYVKKGKSSFSQLSWSCFWLKMC